MKNKTVKIGVLVALASFVLDVVVVMIGCLYLFVFSESTEKVPTSSVAVLLGVSMVIAQGTFVGIGVAIYGQFVKK